jgi:hypothetical protein
MMASSVVSSGVLLLTVDRGHVIEDLLPCFFVIETLKDQYSKFVAELTIISTCLAGPHNFRDLVV